MVAPYIPDVNADNFDEQHANHERTMNQTEQEEIYNKKVLLRRDSIQHLFNGYYYNYNEEMKAKEVRDKNMELAEKSTYGSTMNQQTTNKEVTSKDCAQNQTSKNFLSIVSINNENQAFKSSQDKIKNGQIEDPSQDNSQQKPNYKLPVFGNIMSPEK